MNFTQLRSPSHPSRGIPTAVNCLATLLKEPLVRSSFVQADGVKLLIPLINPVSNQTTPIASSQSNQQQSMQVIFSLFFSEITTLFYQQIMFSRYNFISWWQFLLVSVHACNPFNLLHGFFLLYSTAPLRDVSLYLVIVRLRTCNWIFGYFQMCSPTDRGCQEFYKGKGKFVVLV